MGTCTKFYPPVHVWVWNSTSNICVAGGYLSSTRHVAIPRTWTSANAKRAASTLYFFIIAQYSVLTSKHCDCNTSNKDADEPPFRDLLVSPHKLHNANILCQSLAGKLYEFCRFGGEVPEEGDLHEVGRPPHRRGSTRYHRNIPAQPKLNPAPD
jgi:hypothetical protein